MNQQRNEELNQLLTESGIALAHHGGGLGRARLAGGRAGAAAAADDHDGRPPHLGQQPAPAARRWPAPTTSSPSLARRSTGCSPGWRGRSAPSGSSWPTPRTSCAPRWPGSGPWSRSRCATRSPRSASLRARLRAGAGHRRAAGAADRGAADPGPQPAGARPPRAAGPGRRDRGRRCQASEPGAQDRGLTACATSLGQRPGPGRLAARPSGWPRNLVDNAMRHNVAGGWVEVTTGTRSRPGRSWRWRTPGPVIPPEQVDQLFQPFGRLEATRAQQRRARPRACRS